MIRAQQQQARDWYCVLLPNYANIVGRFASIALTLGEPAMTLWLLIRGAKDQPLEAAA
jgi:hypothetical protein